MEPGWDLAAWRSGARSALAAGISPADIDWYDSGQRDLLGAADIAGAPVVAASDVRVPRAFVQLAEMVLCHREPARLAVLYRLLWRINRGERNLLENPTDPDVIQASHLAQAVRRDTHKMKAFVRFREVVGDQDSFIAWFEPEHHILDRVADFFARRFTGMRWAILTPYRSIRWDGDAVTFWPGARRDEVPGEDAGEELWRTYYANIFNPARLNTRMMRQEMPVKYWKNLPEASLLPHLVRDAGARVQQMHDYPLASRSKRVPSRNAKPQVQAANDLAALHARAESCRQCPLWEGTTRVVFGEGAAPAQLMVVGLHPSDMDDLRGSAFSDPQGMLLAQVVQTAGWNADAVYYTHIVKHLRSKRNAGARIALAPLQSHTQACMPWLRQQLAEVKPRIVVCLGQTALSALAADGWTPGTTPATFIGPAGEIAMSTASAPSPMPPSRIESLRRRWAADFSRARSLLAEPSSPEANADLAASQQESSNQ